MAVIDGTIASETLPGTAGADTITGAGGNDTALMGAGNDAFIWNVGDGDDTVKGGVGSDRIRFTGDNNTELFTIGTLVGGLGGIGRNIGGGSAALDDVERIELQTLGGNDEVRIRDLGPSDVTQVVVDLSNGTPGVGDGKVDILSVEGSIGNNSVTLTQAGGLISVTGLAAKITFAAAETIDSLEIDGLSGNDKINAAALPASVRLTLNGGEGNDTITGSAGIDVLAGGDGNDVVSGGLGNDLANLGKGNDLFVWNPGDGNDTVNGGDGNDTMRYVGAAFAEEIALAAVGGDARLFSGLGNTAVDLNDVERVELRALGGEDLIDINTLAGSSVSAVVVDLASTSGGAAPDKKFDDVTVDGTSLADSIKVAFAGGQVVVTGLSAQVNVAHADKTDILNIRGADGNDVIDAGKLAAAKLALQLFGEVGNDTLLGSLGNDFADGGAGNDLASLGAGNDFFEWNPGDGNDTVEGGTGADELQFVGAAIAETFDLSANAGRLRIARDIGVVTMDVNDVERIEVQAVEGADTITVNDLSGADVKFVQVDFGTGDLAIDIATVNGTVGNDKLQVTLPFGAALITGLPYQVALTGAEAAKDRVIISTLDGNDSVDASKLPAGTHAFIFDGGIGNDTVTGGGGADILVGDIGHDVLNGGANDDAIVAGEGNDTVTGGTGADGASLGDGTDLFLWKSGDGNDTIGGGAHSDTVRFTGINAGDAFNIKANGGETTVVTGDGAVLDLDEVERIEIRPLGEGDAIFVQNLAGTDVVEVAVDLAGTVGGKTADAFLDAVAVNNGAGATMVVTSVGSKMLVTNNTTGQIVSIDHWGKTDILNLGGSTGADILDASLVAAGKMNLRFSSGLGADWLKGGAGNDSLTGGGGADTLFGGAGNDTFVWNSGDGNDTSEGQAGFDTFRFVAYDGSDLIGFEANGGRVQLSALPGTVAQDFDDIERIEIVTLGGPDQVIVGDLSGTDVKQVFLELASIAGVADAAVDIVAVNGNAGNNAIKLGLAGANISITGLSAQVTIAHAGAADLLQINALDGNDSINGAALKLSSAQLELSGGAGNDTLTGGGGNDFVVGGNDNDKLGGGAGDDQLFGDDGKDSLDGGTGNDSMTGGAGNDVLTGGAGDDVATGGAGDDTFTGGAGKDVLRYTSVLDGHDVFVGFDGNAAGGQDTLNLDALFDNLGVLVEVRANRVLVTDNGVSVEIAVDTDADFSYDLVVATLKTADPITVGQDIFVGT